MHTGLNDNLGIALGGLTGQSEAVADIVANAVENLGRHIVMRQDHSILLGLQPIDRRDQRGLQPPFQRRDPCLDLFPQRARLRLDLGGEFKTGKSVSHGPILMLNMSISGA